MRHIVSDSIRTIICLVAFILLLLSCQGEQPIDTERTTKQGIPVEISLASPTGINIADDGKAYLDYQVNGLRVMGYDTNTGRLVFNRMVTPVTADINNSQNPNPDIEWKASVDVVTGDFTIVFIANETVDTELSATLNNDVKVAALADLQKLTINRAALTWDGVIPMLAVYEYVKIKEDNSVLIGGAPVSAPWQVELKHVAVRVDFTLNLDKAQADLWEDAAKLDGWKYYLTVDNTPQKQYLFPGRDNSDIARTSHIYEAQWGNPGYPNAPGLIDTSSTDDYTITFPRLILPESYFTDKDNKNKALTISTEISRDGTTKTPISGTIGYNIDPQKGSIDYTLPRNTYLSVNATMKVADTEMGMKIEVNEWDNGYYEDVTPGTYFFSVDNWMPEYQENVKSHTFLVSIVTTHPDGWTWEAHYEEVPEEEWIMIVDLSEFGIEDAYINIEGWFLPHDVPTQYRTGYLHLKSGNMTKVIKFVQESSIMK